MLFHNRSLNRLNLYGCVFCFLFLFCWESKANPNLEGFGRLSIKYYKGKVAMETNVYSVLIKTDWTNWLIDISGENTHELTYTDGKKTEWICFGPSTTNNQVATQIRLFPGSRPLDSRNEEHIWFAFLSRNHFENHSSPFKEIGLCMDEPCIFTEWKLAKDETSPRVATWHNEWADNRPKATLLKGEFRWLDWTNFGASLILPTKSSLTIYAKPPSGDSVVVSESVLEIDNLATSNIKGVNPPEVLGSCPVYDSRIIRNNVRLEVTYQTQAGKILPVDSPTIARHFARLEQSRLFKVEDKISHDKTTASVRRWAVIAFIAISVFFLFMLVRNSSRKKINNTYETKNDNHS